MSLRPLSPGERLPDHDAGVVVCIPLHGAHELFVQCLHSVLEHTPEAVPILVADDAGPDPASEAWARELDAADALSHSLYWLRHPQNLGYVANVNTAFAACAPADVVLLNSDCVVSDGWLEGLREAAHADSTIATATALTNHGTIVSVPDRNLPSPHLPQELTLDQAAAAVRAASLRIRPRIPTAVGHCVYVRRTALELVGDLDEAFSPAYGEEVDFSQRCLAMGLQHVVADDVLVAHHGGGSLGVDGAANPIQAKHEQILRSRYPYYATAVDDIAEDEHGPLARALAVARDALRGRRVTIDGRCLGRFITGTQIHTLELIGALWRTQRARVRVVVPKEIGDYARDTLAVMPGVELLDAADVYDDDVEIACDDVVHRPYQVNQHHDLRFLARVGARLVVTNQDLIAYRNPTYFPAAVDWVAYRRLTAETLAASAMALFFSRHAADDALAEDLVPAERVRVIHIGVDHRLGSLRPAPAPPGGTSLADVPYLLCLGTDFRHKNRLFALRMFEALLERGWEGRLVLAGPRVHYGSSAGDEAQWLAARPAVADGVVTLPAVDEAEKAWLLANTAALLYPTVYEGFGLVPFEAADAGVPCFFTHQTSLAEVLPDATAVLEPWDAGVSADRALEVLRDPARASALVEEVKAAGAQLTWDRTAGELLTAYDDAVRLPAREWARLTGPKITVDARYWTLRDQIGATGLSLVGPDKPLLPEEAQRTLAALARRRPTRGVLLAALRALRRLAGRDS